MLIGDKVLSNCSPGVYCFSRSSDPGCETGVVEESPEKAITGKHWFWIKVAFAVL